MAKVIDIRNQTKRTNGIRALNKVTHIARHHSATTDGDFFTFWRTWNGVKKWGTGGYHEIILRDGSVQLCYDPEEITNGVGGHNEYTYHICVVGNGSFTAAQEAAFEERCRLAMQRLNIPVDRVLGHKEFKGASTACPGIDMNMVRNRLKKEVKGVATDLPPAQEAVRQEAMRLGITDGNDPHREVKQIYVWSALIPQARKIEDLEKEIEELKKLIK